MGVCAAIRRFGGRQGGDRSQAERFRVPDDRGAEDDVRQPDPEVRHDDAARRRPLASRPGSPRRGSPSGPGSRRTGRRRGWPGTGRGRRRGRAPRRGRPRRRGTSRSRPATTSASAASQSPVITWRTGPNEAAVTTTSAPRDRGAASAATVTSPIPSVVRAATASASARSGCRSNSVRRDARQDAPEHREVAVALDTRADERSPRPRRPVTAGAKCRIATPRDRRGPERRDRTAVEDRGRAARRRRR